MGVRTYRGNSLEECLKLACSEMNISQEKLEYKIIEEKKGIFKKSVTISVEEIVRPVENKNGKVFVVDGKVYIKDPLEGGRPATVRAGQGVCLVVNGERVENTVSVYAKDEISCLFDENESKRLLDISVSEDRLEAFLTIKYIPLVKYRLKNIDETDNAVLEKESYETIMPPQFTADEIRTEISKLGIKFGIQEEELRQHLKANTEEKFIIAKGIPPIHDVEDIISYKFQNGKNQLNVDDNNYKKIDYKNLNLIACVKKGDIIAERVPGTTGKNGTDIYGNVVKRREAKKKLLRVGNGCELRDENTVVALIDGRPCVKSGVLHVNENYEVHGDVNIKNGNVKFVGDVKVYGKVLEGMLVEAGGSVEIENSVENARVIACGDIVIKGNIITSKIEAGGKDVINLRRINELEEFIKQIKALEDTVAEIKKFNLLGYNRSDGEIIKILLETKFKFMTKTCISIIKDSVYDEADGVNKVILLIRGMLVGTSPLSIINYGQLEDLVAAAREKVEELKQKLAVPVNLVIPYCQDSSISSSGDIIITGMGEYVSKITANNSVTFAHDNAVARGGEIYAGKEIRCKTVGSNGGVATRLAVEEDGHIWINTAYQNTILVVGGKEWVLDIPYKNVHAFQGSNGELNIEKLKL
ncbi:flagellar assembly protein A [Clostridium thermarum]|uniref:flagellar assembly protein A n=1 Tax=Clostridium thermarum TaxID=1716543 RepID=UPI001124A03C|nr:flagellar assembly protein A [Clostridium thermarum]